jgi:protein-L-isoaspartate(D-aspartate) O-methyltransferase
MFEQNRCRRNFLCDAPGEKDFPGNRKVALVEFSYVGTCAAPYGFFTFLQDTHPARPLLVSGWPSREIVTYGLFSKGCRMTEEQYRTLREQMVEEQLQQRGICDLRVLDAMRKVPRHLFVSEQQRQEAYADTPLPIGHHQTISQPYIVALMLEALALQGSERVLEVGTGSGYQAALLGELARQVYTVEIIPELAHTAQAMLLQLGYDNVEVVAANGSIGWKEAAPYDAIIVAAASPTIPIPLLAQLHDPGRLILPVGDVWGQTLLRIRKHHGTITHEDLGGCTFVPLVGQEGWNTGAFSK